MILAFTRFMPLLTALFLWGALLYPSSADAELYAGGAFTLLRKIPPGESLAAANTFLGSKFFNRTVDKKEGIGIRRWGTKKDPWFLEALHDREMIRAIRVTWPTLDRGKQQTLFAQLTREGKNFFGRRGRFLGDGKIEWRELNGKWLVRAEIKRGEMESVTLLSGIRDAEMGSERYGF